ncbi:MAG TPA: glutamate--cysteine ligase [Gammaproteobacteria bacterium]
MKARVDWLRERGNAVLVARGLRGLEKESLRVTADGRLSRRPHPPALGSALTHPYLTTDYSEALLEFVTPPLRSNWETLQFLCDLHVFVHQRLDGELLWPASMPCVLNANDEIPIARYGTSNIGMMKTVYRRGLGYRYGRAMQAIAGIHFNFSPPLAFWDALAERTGNVSSMDAFRSSHFMGLARNYRRLAWLVIYLCGASPALCKSFRPEGHELLTELDPGTWHAPFATSLRMSDIGYRNTTQARLQISLNSAEEYVAGLAAAVSTVEPRYAAIGVEVDGEYRQLNANILQIENEYYTPIRPKPAKGQEERPTVALRRRGVDYVEVRTLDLNPADPVGVNQNALRFLETLLLHCLLSPSPPIGAAELEEIDRRDLLAAREGRRPGLELPRDGGSVALRDWGREVLDELGEIAELLDRNGEGYSAALAAQRDAIEDPDATPSARLLDALRQSREPFFEHMHALARAHHDYFLGLGLGADRGAELEAAAAQSIEAQRRLEAEPAPPFREFLARYFENV